MEVDVVAPGIGHDGSEDARLDAADAVAQDATDRPVQVQRDDDRTSHAGIAVVDVHPGQRPVDVGVVDVPADAAIGRIDPDRREPGAVGVARAREFLVAIHGGEVPDVRSRAGHRRRHRQGQPGDRRRDTERRASRAPRTELSGVHAPLQ
jgi:hypothetical protein